MENKLGKGRFIRRNDPDFADIERAALGAMEEKRHNNFLEGLALIAARILPGESLVIPPADLGWKKKDQEI